jgi:hypothetical protein
MDFNSSNLALLIAAVGVLFCPTLCGIMAYRVSRNYQMLRNAG